MITLKKRIRTLTKALKKLEEDFQMYVSHTNQFYDYKKAMNRKHAMSLIYGQILLCKKLLRKK